MLQIDVMASADAAAVSSDGYFEDCKFCNCRERQVAGVIDVANLQEIHAIKLKTQLVLLAKQLNDERRQKLSLEERANESSQKANEESYRANLLQNQILSPLKTLINTEKVEPLDLDLIGNIKVEDLENNNGLYDEFTSEVEPSYEMTKDSILFENDKNKKSKKRGNQNSKSLKKYVDNSSRQANKIAPEYSISCPICKIKFSSAISRLIHYQNACSDKAQIKGKITLIRSRELLNARRKYLRIRRKEYQCSLCSRKFSWQNSLVIHKKRCHAARKFILEEQEGYKQLKDVGGMKEDDFGEGMDIPVPGRPDDSSLTCSFITKNNQTYKEYHCQECSFSSTHKRTLQRHVKGTHANFQDFSCEQCDFTSNLRQYLAEHLKNKHNIVKNVKCDRCEFQSWSESDLSRHKRIHKPIEDKKCKECDYVGEKTQWLLRHINAVHNKIKDHRCKECDYASARKDSLNRHIKNMHETPDSNVCDQCGFSTAHPESLLRHMKGVHKKRGKVSGGTVVLYE